MFPSNRHLALATAVLLVLPIITVCFTPPPIAYAAATLTKSTIWIFGGIDQNKSFLNTLWSLDVSRAFLLSSPPWIDHSSDAANQTFVYARGSPALEASADNTTLWVYGGVDGSPGVPNRTRIITYNIDAKSWSIPPIQGTPLDLESHAVARVGNGILYYFGGATDNYSNTSGTPSTRIDTVESLNTSTGEYKIINAAPSNLPGRFGHSATTVGTKIYIIGGGATTSSTSSLNGTINTIDVFDTVSNSWTSQTATGKAAPKNRRDHSAVLTSDGKRIIVIGGSYTGESMQNDVWALDVIHFEWTLVTITASTSSPISLSGANAIIVDKQMLIMFGIDSNHTTSNKMYALDMSTNPWTWINSFTPTTETDFLVRIAVAGSVLLLAMGVSACYCYAKRKYGVHRNQEPPNGAPSPTLSLPPPLYQQYETPMSNNEPRLVEPSAVDPPANTAPPTYSSEWRVPDSNNVRYNGVSYSQVSSTGDRV